MIVHQGVLVLSLALVLEVTSDGCSVGDLTFSAGEPHIIPGFCSHRICQGNNDWSLDACPYTTVPSGWTYVPNDPALPYPQCCGRANPPLDIVPDILPSLASVTGVLDVRYGDLEVNNGNDLTPTQVQKAPTISYPVAPGGLYLVGMVDPDAPSRENPYLREFLHHLAGNIPGRKLQRKIPSDALRRSIHVVADYIGAAPPNGTGFHRYFFLLYKQPYKIIFEEPFIPNNTIENRTNFSIARLAKKYNLGQPIAVNVLQAKYDDFVPILSNQIGFT